MSASSRIAGTGAFAALQLESAVVVHLAHILVANTRLTKERAVNKRAKSFTWSVYMANCERKTGVNN